MGSSEANHGRHNLIRDATFAFLKRSLPTNHTVEKEAWIPNPIAGERQLKADIAIFSNGTAQYFDFKITNPSNRSYISDGLINVGDAAKDAEKAKITHYVKSYGDCMNEMLTPLVMETTGRLGPEFSKFLEAKCNFSIPDDRLKSAREFLNKRISALLAKGNARIIRTTRDRTRPAIRSRR